jgi:hypothetical protein
VETPEDKPQPEADLRRLDGVDDKSSWLSIQHPTEF